MEIMSSRCTQCGYENNDQYRFCGSCGAILQTSAPTAGEAPARPERSAVPQVSGLSEPSKRNLDYLLEEEPPSTHWRMYVALLLLVISAGVLAWHWNREGYPWPTRSSAPAAAPITSGTPESLAYSNPQAQAPVATSAEKPRTTTPNEAAPAPAQAETAQQPAVQPVSTSSVPAPSGQSTTSESAQPGGTTSPGPQAETANSETAATTPSQKTAAPPSTDATSTTEVSPPAAQMSREDRLVSEGEKYLYGNGVAENCDQAQRNLRNAALRSNAKAQSILGTMYATGHCVARDLPTAYRWFARALHQDPKNDRIQRDLEVLWKQMTPGERQFATRSEQ